MKKYPSMWQKIALISSAGVGLLSTFLPWVSVSVLGYSSSANAWGFGNYGPLFGLLIFVITAVVIILSALAMGLKKDQLAFGSYLAGIIGGALMLIISIIILASAGSWLSVLGFGLWLEIITAVATIVFGILGLALKAKPAKK